MGQKNRPNALFISYISLCNVHFFLFETKTVKLRLDDHITISLDPIQEGSHTCESGRPANFTAKSETEWYNTNLEINYLEKCFQTNLIRLCPTWTGLPSWVTRGPPESPLQAPLPPAPEVQMLLAWIRPKNWMLHCKLVIILTMTSRRTGLIAVALSESNPQPLILLETPANVVDAWDLLGRLIGWMLAVRC